MDKKVKIGIGLILIVLLFGCTGECISCDEPINVLAEALSTGYGSSQKFSQSFTLENGDTITSYDFEAQGFGPKMIIFGVGDFEESNVEAGFLPEEEGSFLRYEGVTNIEAKAMIICHPTGSELSASLEEVEETVPEGLCLTDDSIPCCAIILKRP